MSTDTDTVHEVVVYAGPVYRVHIMLPSDTPGTFALCPMAEAFAEWVYKNKVLPVRGTTASGPNHYIADFPMNRQAEIEEWFDAWEEGS